MNIKTKELAEQAKASVPAGLLVNEWIDKYNEIFAELIVQECGVALSPVLHDMVSRGQAYDLIKQHFGVK
jgi:hypothetical protein